MAGEAQVGPYIANLKIEAEERAAKAEAIEEGISGLANLPLDITRTMFALNEYNDRKAKENMDALNNTATLYGWDRMPQSDVNKYANALKTRYGIDVPRDDQGNAIPPPNSTETEKSRLFATLTPQQKMKALYPKAFPDPNKLTAEQQANFKMEDQRIARIRAAADMARATQPKDFQLDSGYVRDADTGELRETLPNEKGMSRGQLKAQESALRIEASRGLDMMKARVIQQSLTEEPVAVRNMTKSLLMSKDYDTRKLGWDQLREMTMRSSPGYDIGPMPPPKGWDAYITSLFNPGAYATPRAQAKGTKEMAQKAVDLLRERRRKAKEASDYSLVNQLDQQIRDIEKAPADTTQGPPRVLSIERVPSVGP